MPPITEQELRVAFRALYDHTRRYLAGRTTESSLRVTLQEYEPLWRRVRTEKPPTAPKRKEEA